MKLNLSTEALARSSAAHPWRTIAVWAVVLGVAGVLIFTLLEDALTTDFAFTNNPESWRADKLLEESLRGPRKVNEVLLVRSERLTVGDQAFRDRVKELYGAVMGLGSDVIAGGVSYYETGLESLVSADRRTTIVPLQMAGDFDQATDDVKLVMDIAREANGRDGFEVLIVGSASIAVESNEVAESDLRRGVGFGVPVALIILVLVFGALLVPFIPLVLAVFSIVVALGATALIGQAFELSFFVTNMIEMIGLAVGIDYSMFIVFRYREERSRGLEKMEAIARAGATASRAVFFSGMTVVLPLVGMLIIPTTIFQSLGTGAILVVIASVMASLTLLPAVLGLIGDRVNAIRVPVFGSRLAEVSGERRGGFWDWMARSVMRRPVVSLVVTAGVLIAAAIAYFDINIGAGGIRNLPDTLETKQAFLLLEKEFSFGVVSPAEIVVDGDVNSDAVQAGIGRLEAALDQDPDFVGRSQKQDNGRDLTLLSIPVDGDPTGDVAIDAINRLRGQYIPQAFSGVQADVLVTGETAFNVDFFEITDRFTPVVFVVVLGLSFVLLTLVFRSIVVPVKAIIMNLLSVGSAYGLVVLVIQKGYGADLLGFQRADMIEAWIPLFMFSVLFGLSMDYHVFLLSRIRERYDQRHDNTDAVAFGLRSTARIITGAALIMVAVFGAFASGDLVGFQQVGFGLAVAVFLDATIVRMVLVPASMRLLGHANWYFPSFLGWLPDLRVEGEEPGLTPKPIPEFGHCRGESCDGE